MTTAQLIEKLSKRVEQLDEAKLVMPVATEIHRRKINRVFEGGQKAGGRIGTYSTKEMLATRSQFVVKSAFKQTVEKVTLKRSGKTKNRPKWIKFPKASKAVPVMVLTGGYKQFRQIQGRESGKVNLRYTNDLHNDLATKLRTKGKTVVSGVSRTLNAKKIEGLEKKYGNDLLKHTDEEKKFYHGETRKRVTAHLFA